MKTKEKEKRKRVWEAKDGRQNVDTKLKKRRKKEKRRSQRKGKRERKKAGKET